MPNLDVLNMMGEKVGEIQLNDTVFGAEVNKELLHQVVVNYLANQRQGTQSAKTRAEVRGGGRKPFRQKGTGNARQGTIRAPHFAGGGIVFAPKPRDYSYVLPKKLKRAALRSALSSKVSTSNMIVLESLELAAPKTKDMVALLKNLKVAGKALVVTLDKNDNVVFSANNLQNVATSFVGQINVYEILNHTSLVITKAAVEKLEEVYA